MLWILLSIIIFLAYWLLCFFYSYWDRQGVPNIKASIPFGNLKPTVRKEKPFSEVIYDLYKSTKLPYIGIYLLFRPVILIRDAVLVKTILTKDFNYFHDRGSLYNKNNDPFSVNLFAMTGQKWQSLRSKMTPAFTSGKIKNILPTMLDVAKKLEKSLVSNVTNNNVLEVKDLIICFTVDIIGSVIFGVEVDSINNPKHEFREIGRKESACSDTIQVLRSTVTFLCPKYIKENGLSKYQLLMKFFRFLDLFRVNMLSKYIKNYIVNLVNETIIYREKENITRKDFMQLLLQIRNTGKTNLDGVWEVQTVAENLKTMTIEECASNAYLFYTAGSESSASIIYFSLHELTKNQLIMDKLVDELDKVLEHHKSKITYECLKDMTYLDVCVKETLRMYPGISTLNRICTQSYRLPGTEFTIKKGTQIIISLLGLHRDQNNFRNPEKYIPERFLAENIDFIEDAYMPFGDGPRNCIAYGMGLTMIKIGLVTLLSKFKFEATDFKPMEAEKPAQTENIQIKVSFRK